MPTKIAAVYGPLGMGPIRLALRMTGAR
jgi:hypothetical protein